ncbi:MAG TPA: class I SAM-dependent methyltransferase [Candidatus Saccharimonadales bacterium]|nr:class I SAM-dependent methyltransferase [Candidatus Saccharimonadales bacterium]
MTDRPASLLRLRVSAAAESRLRARHPWVFSDSIRGQNRPGELGELAVVYDRNNQFLALGLFDPDSPIRVRILHAGKPRVLDAAWWQERLRAALARRDGLCDEQTTACRWIHGESDDWPGLVLDRYDTTLALKLYTAAWLPRLEEVIALLQTSLQPAQIVLRLSRNIQALAHEKFQRSDGEVCSQPPGAGPAGGMGRVCFLETGLRFEADVVKGQKTGFFLDQRENRRRVEGMAAGRRVLNAFSFSGGFSLYAARGGARSVTDLDISAHALESARRNFALNVAVASVAQCAHETVQADAFAWLEQGTDRKFDLIVLDPPSLARREAERAGALAAYGRLVASALRALSRGGRLVAASCSAHVAEAEFFEVVLREARLSGRLVRELDRTGHPPDHPAGFPEAAYLKCIYLETGLT